MTDPTKIVGKECRFAIHIPSRASDQPDVHLVKEVIHYEDGRIEPNIRFIQDMTRNFWVTKTAYRNHEQKKEREDLDKLTCFSSTQSNLRFRVARALDKAYSPMQMNMLADSPYLYGSDISSTSIIKYQYQTKYPDTISMYSVAFFDIETDVVHGTNDPIMATIVFKDKIFFTVQKSFYAGYSNPEERYFAAVKKYIQPYIDKHQFKIEMVIVEDPIELIKRCLEKLHEWIPDFVAIWNISFDIPRLIETLEKYGHRPEDYFCYPKLPESMRFCKFKKGSTKKITASGQYKPKNPSEQWHSLLCPAGFWFIDQMSSYRFVRLGGQEEQEYNLNYILTKVLGRGKLSFSEADHLTGLQQHAFLQEKYPFEYSVYNNFDCIGAFELEMETNDLSTAVPTMAGITDFTRFDSQTKRFADAYHYHLLEHNQSVIGTIPPTKKENEEEEADYIGDADEDYVDGEEDQDDEEVIAQKADVLSLRNWINKGVTS
jgi:CRISPR/Cas system-associated endoribonuclease Cas2